MPLLLWNVSGSVDFIFNPFLPTWCFGASIITHLFGRFSHGETPPEDANLKNDKLRLTPSDFRALPKETVMKFKTSVEVLEMDMALNVIEEIREQNKPLADALQKLAEEYRFDTLQKLLDQS